MCVDAVHGVYIPGGGTGPVRVCIWRRDGTWVCLCADSHLASEGRSKEEALLKLKKQLSSAPRDRTCPPEAWTRGLSPEKGTEKGHTLDGPPTRGERAE